MPDFEEFLARILEEPAEVLGILSDVVNSGRIQADVLPQDSLRTLAQNDLVVFLFEKRARQAPRSWVYPSPMGLRIYAMLEREAERAEEAEPRPRTKQRRR